MRSRLSAVVILCATLVLGPSVAAVPPAASLDVADISYLWPVPTSQADVDALMTCRTPTADGTPLLPQAAFQSILDAVDSTVIKDRAGRDIRIAFDSTFADRFKDPATWKVVGFRFDPAAVGHRETIEKFGVMPQLRLIVQPVTVDGGQVEVHDMAAHLVFGYFTGATPPFKADQGKLAEVVAALADLKAASPAPTSGPLGVHPGLKTRDAAFARKVQAFIARFTAPSKGPLAAISFMGIDTPEPWIFFALKPAPAGTFVPAPQATMGGSHAQMISFRSGVEIMPLSTGKNTGSAGKIISTAALFERDARTRLDNPAADGVPRMLRQDIPDYIANPEVTHVFNTDCVSCHTESTRRRVLNLGNHVSEARYARPADISGVDPAVLPKDKWNVRNFGWFETEATVSMRAANEAAESVAVLRRMAAPTAPASPSTQAQLLRVSFRREPRRTTPVTLPATQPAPSASTAPIPVATPLTLVMEAKSPQDLQALKALIAGMQGKPPDQNPIRLALNRLRIVHYARFVFLDDRHLAVITTFDGSFDDYIDAFVNTIGDVFNALMAHVKDAPPLPVQKFRKEFLAYVKAHDKGAVQPFYSAYPELTVGEILGLQHEAAGKKAPQP